MANTSARLVHRATPEGLNLVFLHQDVFLKLLSFLAGFADFTSTITLLGERPVVPVGMG